MRPCNCDNVTSAVYSTDQCRRCWKWHYDRDYRAHYDPSYSRRFPLPQCEHLGAATGETVACNSCPGAVKIKLHSCDAHGVCTPHKKTSVQCCIGCPDASPILPAITHVGGLPSDRSFNASIAEWNGKTYLAFRKYWAGARIGICEVDENFQVKGLIKTLALGKLLQDRESQEDPRLFVHRGALHVSYTGVNWSIKQPVSVCWARLTEELDAAESFYLDFAGRREWEKNWAFFDQRGDLYAVYEPNPHRVLLYNARHFWEIPRTREHMFPQSNYGMIRGGAPPICHNGEYYCFVHGVTEDRIYTIGLITLEDKPPFMPKRWIPSPILWPDPSESPGPHVANVVFPGGAIHRGGKWHVCYGLYDEHIRIASWDATQIERLLRPC